MAYSSKAREKMERLVPEKAAKAVKVAYKEALNAGRTILIVANGKLFRVAPDGTRTELRAVPKRIPAVKGARLKIQ